MAQKSDFEPSEHSGLFSGGLEDKNVERNIDGGGLPCALSERCFKGALKNSIEAIQQFESVASGQLELKSAVISKRPEPLKQNLHCDD